MKANAGFSGRRLLAQALGMEATKKLAGWPGRLGTLNYVSDPKH